MRSSYPIALAVALAACGETPTTTGSTSTSTGGGGAGAGTSSSSPASSSSGAGSSGAGSAGTGGAPAMCTTADTCPGQDGPCSSRTCDDGTCGVDLVPNGTVIQEQIPGDCAELVCQDGDVTSNYSAIDTEDDGIECTADACSPGGPTHEPMPAGSSCSSTCGCPPCGPSMFQCTMGLCNAATECKAFIPVKCNVGGTIFQGCDGFFHGGLSIVWGDGPEFGNCAGVATDVGYCAPGEPCAASYDNDPTQFGVCL